MAGQKGRSGRLPKPTAMIVNDGLLGHREYTERIEFEKAVPELEEIEIPELIKNDKYAKAEWERVAPILKDLGLLKTNDTSALQIYCKSWSRYIQAELQIDQAGSTIIKTQSGYVQQIPQIAIALKYAKMCRSYMIEFGLTPSSRGRMQLPGDTSDDEMEELLKGND